MRWQREEMAPSSLMEFAHGKSKVMQLGVGRTKWVTIRKVED